MIDRLIQIEMARVLSTFTEIDRKIRQITHKQDTVLNNKIKKDKLR